MKKVIQLDSAGYFIGITIADESPLEPGVYHFPANTIDTPLRDIPSLKEGQRLRWHDAWIVEDAPDEVIAEKPPIPQDPVQPQSTPPVNETPQWYIDRVKNYPNVAVYIDGVVKGDQAQIDSYIETCLAVKANYPKPESE